MIVPDTPANAAIAELVTQRMRHERARTTWAVVGLRAAGICGCIALVGLGIGAAALGVVSVLRARSNPDDVARHVAAIVRGGHVVRVAGAVQASGEVAVMPGQSVALAPGGRVGLQDDAKVRISWEETPKPTEAQLKSDARAASDARVATNFTVFKSVPYQKGFVVTGWSYTTSAQDRPDAQYCYYNEPVESNSSVRIDVGLDRRYLAPRTPAHIDGRAAFSNCVWN